VTSGRTNGLRGKARWRTVLLPAALAVVLVVPALNRHPVPEPALPPAAIVEAKKIEPPRRRPGFLSTVAGSPYPFRSAIGVNPEQVCDRLDEAGFANSGWRGAEVAGVWECMALLQAPADGGAGEVLETPQNSLFYLLRGRASRRINYARMKINLLDPAGEAKTLADAVRFMELFAAAAGFDLPADLRDAILEKTPATVVTRDVNFKLKPEFDDPARFNLSIEFGPTLYSFYRTPAPEPRPAASRAVPEADGKGGRLRKAE
jgi:hypothetical protein